MVDAGFAFLLFLILIWENPKVITFSARLAEFANGHRVEGPSTLDL